MSCSTLESLHCQNDQHRSLRMTCRRQHRNWLQLRVRHQRAIRKLHWWYPIHLQLQQSPKLDAAREQRRIYPIPDGDPEHEEIVNSARRKLEMTASPMPCQVITADPNGSSWERAGASDWFKMETKRLRSSCSKQDHENIIIESHRIRTAKCTAKTHEDHNADRGHVSMSNCNMVHKLMPIPKAMSILEAQGASDKEVDKVAESTDLGRVQSGSGAEVMRRSNSEGEKVHFATLMDRVSTQQLRIGGKVPKTQRKMVLRCDLGERRFQKLHCINGANASTSHMTAEKVLDVISEYQNVQDKQVMS